MENVVTEEIRVRGTVQGVGFRPTVYRLAKAWGLYGDVCNDGEGVLIRVSGNEETITGFVNKLYEECPPLATIEQLTRTSYPSELKFNDFVIADSVSNSVTTAIAPDAAICRQCQQEIFDPFSRFFRYPFTNCTHCGPRLSIILGLPYDRCNTSMSAFSMCPQCQQEYDHVESRRFHAQPVACHACGPRAWLERADGQPVTAAMFSMLDDVDAVCTLLQRGEIVAIKGLGGVHLACDATQEAAVQKLRQRKQRYHKPLALMARDMSIITEYCLVNSREKQLLTSAAAPIVLLRKKTWKNREITPKFPIASAVAPGQNTLGFMLPYTALHHLILRRMNRPIVLSSGNMADEPQCIDNQEAREKLGKIADYFLLHDREIVNRVDDSVVRVIDHEIQVMRRARGYAPAPMKLPPGFERVTPILAMGGELKSTFCLLRDNQAIISQHLGNLENAAAFHGYKHTLNLYLSLFEVEPAAIAVDKHPEYLSTKFGEQLASVDRVRLHYVQHHHAHIAACMVENGVSLNASPVIGVALDGLGYGQDGQFWGGEFLLADYRQFRRLASFKPVAMIGGEKAMVQPWRNTYAHLLSANLWHDFQQKYSDLKIIKFLQQQPLSLLNQLVKQEINSPPASSVGRLFDAVAAAMGVCLESSSYEGQAAMAMEALVDPTSLNNHKEGLTYPLDINFLDRIYYINSKPMWRALFEDLQNLTPLPEMARRFHEGLAQTIINLAKHLCDENLINHVVLTGGVFQNSILLTQVKVGLENLGINVLTHHLVPANDGNISLGQAAITAAQLITNS